MKYRAWHTLDHKWVTDEVVLWNGYIYKDGRSFEDGVDCTCIELSYSTGLFDKNGTEIFIGDLLKIEDETTEGFYRTDYYEVIINDFMQIPVIDSEIGQDVSYKYHKIMEVSGNIYEEKSK